jgi:hypothetical protein
MQHAEIAACKPQGLFLPHGPLQFVAPLYRAVCVVQPDGMIAAETAIDISLAVQP